MFVVYEYWFDANKLRLKRLGSFDNFDDAQKNVLKKGASNSGGGYVIMPDEYVIQEETAEDAAIQQLPLPLVIDGEIAKSPVYYYT